MQTYVDQDIYERDLFRCRYCGYDGRHFDHWMQLTIDHVIPRSANGPDDATNKVVCCYSCNTLTSRHVPVQGESTTEAVARKRAYVASRRVEYHKLWLGSVAPKWLSRGLE